MIWLEANWIKMLAVIGGVYTVARAIVALTPTKADDEWLEKNMPILRKLAKLIGLDLNQGKNIKD